jgi:hypothetical protein
VNKLPRPPKDTPHLYEQDGKGYDAIVHAHYFLGASDWLVTEYDGGIVDMAFGWACLNGDRQNAELGYVELAQLEAVTQSVTITSQGRTMGQLAVHVELELDWTPIPLHAAIALLDQRQGGPL